MISSPVEIAAAEIRNTIALLRRAGQRECVLLWLGRREDGVQRIVTVYHPLQESARDYFEIPRRGMAALMEHLRSERLYVVSQVHTHPCEAFHSAADDKWAIVRHLGALSIVLPEFATSTTTENFLEQAAIFQLHDENGWNQLEAECIAEQLRIIP